MVMAENMVAIPYTCCRNTVAAILDLRLSLLNVVEKCIKGSSDFHLSVKLPN